MIDRLPKYSQAPVRNYLETGKFKDQTPSPIPVNEAVQIAEDVVLMSMGIMSQDNVKEVDSNPATGVMDVQDDFLGAVHLEFEASQEKLTTQGFAEFGQGQQAATVFARDTADTLDVVVVSSGQGADDGVIHIDHNHPEKSFMTFSDESMGRFLLGK